MGGVSMDNLRKLRKNVAIGAQKGFADAFNALVDFAEKLEGAGNIKVDKSNWPNVRITLSSENPPPPSGIPPGYEELSDSIVDIQWDSTSHKIQIKRGTVLVKTGTVGTSWSDLLTFEEYNI